LGVELLAAKVEVVRADDAIAQSATVLVSGSVNLCPHKAGQQDEK